MNKDKEMSVESMVKGLMGGKGVREAIMESFPMIPNYDAWKTMSPPEDDEEGYPEDGEDAQCPCCGEFGVYGDGCCELDGETICFGDDMMEDAEMEAEEEIADVNNGLGGVGHEECDHCGKDCTCDESHQQEGFEKHNTLGLGGRQDG